MGEVPVTFKFDKDKPGFSYAQVAVREDHDGIPHLNVNGAAAYAIHPRAANSIDIYLIR